MRNRPTFAGYPDPGVCDLGLSAISMSRKNATIDLHEPQTDPSRTWRCCPREPFSRESHGRIRRASLWRDAEARTSHAHLFSLSSPQFALRRHFVASMRLLWLSDIALMMLPKAYLFLSHCYSASATSGQAKSRVAKALTRDQARRIVAELPELLGRKD